MDETINNSEQLENFDENELQEILLNTREQCQMVESMIKNQIEVKDELINKLHGELEYYRQDSNDRFVDQLMKALIKVRKDMKRLIFSSKWDELTLEDFKREYNYVYEDLTDLLEQQNVDEYITEAGELFDASKHQTKVEVTVDKSLDKTIKKSLSEGYTRGKKVIVPERVVTYQFKG